MRIKALSFFWCDSCVITREPLNIKTGETSCLVVALQFDIETFYVYRGSWVVAFEPKFEWLASEVVTLIHENLNLWCSHAEATAGRDASFHSSINYLLLDGDIWLDNLNQLEAAKSRDGAFFVSPVLLRHRHYLSSEEVGDA